MSELAEFDPPSGANGLRATDEQHAAFATVGWVDAVAQVPINEVSTMVAEDPSVVSALIGALRYARKRHQDALALAARISQETPLPDEVNGWTDQRAKMIAAIGTLQARIAEIERARADPTGMDIAGTRAGMGSFDRNTKAWLWHALDVALIEIADWRDGRLDDALEAAWTAWCERHKLELHGYLAEDLESHIVGEDEDEDEETLAARAKERASE